ncbi:MarR family winged helix-turn-helix transcriptional regulator [Paenisporosarcina indica]|uniref:MarR family winged helix-turn-helix transcriptional regulator n=1 Tax=Paenisporosarcina indica TaxID=650093 RepID=UPI00094F8CA9|nr:MarR family transcriptional regulator [Paenisporosarcina indica]
MSEKIIQDIKSFNRFYTRAMGLFNLYTDKSAYSATEALILFQISTHEFCTAAYLSNFFLLDKSYMSRILKHFEKKGLIEKKVSKEDRRIYHIELTKAGGDVLNLLADKASLNVQSMIDGISEEEIEVLIDSMKKIEKVLYPNIN